MKLLVIACFYLCSEILFAQENASSSNSIAAVDQSNFYLGFEYLNTGVIRNEAGDYGLEDSDIRYAESKNIGYRADLFGIGFGYNAGFRPDLGYNLALKFIDSIKENHGKDNLKIRMLLPELNLAFEFKQRGFLYGGINYGLMYGFSHASKWSSAIGGQLGLGYRLKDKVILKAGYTFINARFSETQTLVGGAISSITTERKLADSFNGSLELGF